MRLIPLWIKPGVWMKSKTLYVALLTSADERDELQENWYQRQPVTFDESEMQTHPLHRVKFDNDNEVSWYCNSIRSKQRALTVSHFAIFEQATGGHAVFLGALHRANVVYEGDSMCFSEHSIGLDFPDFSSLFRDDEFVETIRSIRKTIYKN